MPDILFDAFSSPERPSARKSSDSIDLSAYQEFSPTRQSTSIRSNVKLSTNLARYPRARCSSSCNAELSSTPSLGELPSEQPHPVKSDPARPVRPPVMQK